MTYRLTKIYTRKGDDGTTSLDARNRILKNSVRIETIGTIDELNSVIGMVIASGIKDPDLNQALQKIQQNLFNLGGELCPPHTVAIHPEKITELEHLIDTWNKELPPLKEFILPGGNLPSATCHFARTVCRRAERCLVTLHNEEPVNPDILRFVNRLSDVLFVAARMLAKETESDEILWDHQRKKST